MATKSDPKSSEARDEVAARDVAAGAGDADRNREPKTGVEDDTRGEVDASTSDEHDASPPSLDDIVFPPGWEQGSPLPDDFIDDELAGDDFGRTGDFATPLLVVLVAVFAGWLAAQYTLELRYFFTDREPIALGDAESLQNHPEWYGEHGLELPSNRHVTLSAMLGSSAISGDESELFYKTIGAQIIVQRNHEQDLEERRSHLARRQARDDEESLQPLHEGVGRIVAFEDLPARYQSIATYFSERLEVEYCGVEPTRRLERRLENLRERTRERLRERYDRDPTDEEVDNLLGPRARCQNGYMFLSEQTPTGMWYFVVLYIIFLIALLGSAFVLLRWHRRTYGSGSD